MAPAEDAEKMAQGIAVLYEHPERFGAMSEAAAKRVREQSGMLNNIDEEIGQFN